MVGTLAPASVDGRIAIEVTRESEMNAIYGEEYHDVVTIDRERAKSLGIAVPQIDQYG